MNRTPRGRGGFYSRFGPHRGLTADQVADMAGYENYQSGFQRHNEGYGPNESLLSGEYHSLSTLDDENIFTPLTSSSRYNSVRGQGQGNSRHSDGTHNSTGELNLTAMLQEQHILYQILDTRKKMQKKRRI